MASAPMLGPRLVAREGGEVVQALELMPGKEKWLIGRSLESDLCVEQSSLSRRHCEISRSADGCFYVTDLSSVHGTHYAGAPLEANQPMRLFDGVVLTFGGQLAREYSTVGVPLVPVQPPLPPTTEGGGAGRAVRGAAPRPEGLVDAVGDESGAPDGATDAELQEMFGLPMAFASSGPVKPVAVAVIKAPKPKPTKKGGKIQLGANLGAKLGVAPDAPKPEAEEVEEAEEVDPMLSPPGKGALEKGAMAPPPTRPIAAPDRVPSANGDGGEDDDELVGPPIPREFAGGSGAAADDDDDDDFVGPPMPPGGVEEQSEDEEDDEYSDEEEAAEEAASLDRFRLRLPTSHSVAIRGHTKVVTVISLDAAGARMVTGSSDYSMRMYDFNGMASDFRPFRMMEEPMGSYQLRSVDWSPSNSNFVVGASSPQPKLFDRDGKELSTLKRGDMYLRDLKHTQGHIAAVTCVRWHPSESLLIATAGEDGSVRTWDVEHASNRDDKTAIAGKSGQLRCWPVKDTRGHRSAVTSFDWHSDGQTIALSSADGSIQLIDTRHHDTKSQLIATGAHVEGTLTACVRFAPATAGSGAGHLLASRGGVGDDTMKLWDLRMFRAAAAATLGGGRTCAAQPVHCWSGLRNNYATAPCVWSPNGQLLCTGTSVDKGEDSEGALLAFRIDAPVTEPPLRESVGPKVSVAALAWHPRLNQIFAGGSDGAVLGFYEPSMSERGLLYCASRAVKRREVEMGDVSAMQALNIRTPHALPLFKEGLTKSRKRGREREIEKDGERRIPMRPPPGVGTGGRVGSNVSHALIKTVDKNLNSFRDEVSCCFGGCGCCCCCGCGCCGCCCC